MTDTQIPPAPDTTDARPDRSRLKPLLLGVVLGLVAGVGVATAIMSSRFDGEVAAAVSGERSRVAAEEAAESEQVAAEEASEDSRLAGLLPAASEACDNPDGLDVLDGGSTLTFDMEGEDEVSGASIDDIVCVLLELAVPSSIVANMEQTTAMDGRQSGTWDDFEMTWSYHPDRGMDGVITVQ